MREFPVWQKSRTKFASAFGKTCPPSPRNWRRSTQSSCARFCPSPREMLIQVFSGWVQGGGTAVGMLAEMLAAGLNANAGGRDQIPLEVEKQVTHWMRTLFSFPPPASGLFVTGTSMANLLAVLIARDARLGLMFAGAASHPALRS